MCVCHSGVVLPHSSRVPVYDRELGSLSVKSFPVIPISLQVSPLGNLLLGMKECVSVCARCPVIQGVFLLLAMFPRMSRMNLILK